MLPPLTKLPWDLAKDEFGAEGTDFISILSGVLLRSAKDQFRMYVADLARVSGTLPSVAEKTNSSCAHTEASALMKSDPPVLG
jgi:hypothetical protein